MAIRLTFLETAVLCPTKPRANIVADPKLHKLIDNESIRNEFHYCFIIMID